MKIGLLTVYFADYGSFYHTISLYRLLEELGHEVELIDESHRYKRSPKLFISSMMQAYAPDRLNQIFRRHVTAYNTYCALKGNLKDIKIASRKNLLSTHYDCVVVGSDELWSFTNPTIKFIKTYFGIGISVPHISYATSGITLDFHKVKPNKKKQIVAGLKTFAWLSARDDVTKQWVEQWSGKPCKKVLDPTLLNPYFVQQSEQKNVIVVYGEHFSAQQQAAIIQFAKKENMPLQAIAWRHRWCDSFLEVTRGGGGGRAGRLCRSRILHKFYISWNHFFYFSAQTIYKFCDAGAGQKGALPFEGSNAGG